MRSLRRLWVCIGVLLGAMSLSAWGGEPPDDAGARPGLFGIRVQVEKADTPEAMSAPIKIFLLLTALSLAPSAVVMMTSFTRILVVLGFLRQALGTQQEPPGQLLAAMSLFLTIYVMMPVWSRINEDALQPYLEQRLSEKEAWVRAAVPLKRFMLEQTGDKELRFFYDLARRPLPERREDVPLDTLIPAFMISELKTAFQMGFLLYLPFLVIDLVVATILMSLGMMMLPPMMISLPVKLLFFVLADGWTLVIRGVAASFCV